MQWVLSNMMVRFCFIVLVVEYLCRKCLFNIFNQCVAACEKYNDGNLWMWSQSGRLSLETISRPLKVSVSVSDLIDRQTSQSWCQRSRSLTFVRISPALSPRDRIKNKDFWGII